jgi:rSAM/selenodomain-associated transferase 2
VPISVVIPTLNEEATIAATLRSTAHFGFHEIIVVDGGSTDGTIAVVNAFVSTTRQATPRIIRLLSSPPGRARQLNVGANAAGGDVVLFLHADTHLPPSAASSIEAALADDRVVGGRFDVQFDSRSPWGSVIGSLMNLRSRLTGICTGDQALFVRKTAFTQLQGFADIPLMEDVEFTARLKRQGRIAALHDRVTTSFRRWEKAGPLRTVVLMWTLRLLYWMGMSPSRLSPWYKLVR